ncbi:MAG: two-component system, OmpR family, sensor histidine kinase PrrB [Solirubrobacteraceae bacterium]|nr:two-component system, OmpR family, sensor histidine kinase PrrB [Solirubrobacteraceae bacterium]
MRSLRGRLTIGITLVLAVAIAGAGIMVSRYVDGSERDALDERLERTAALSRETSLDALETAVPPRDRRLDDVLSASRTSLRLIVGGLTIRESGARPPSDFIPKRDGLRTFSAGGRRYRSYITSVPVPGLGGLARFEVTSPLRPLEDRLAALDRRLAAFGLGALLLGGLGAWLAATLLLRPLRRLRAATATIAGTDDLDQRVRGDDGPGELRSLAASFNDMLARLGRSAADRERALAATRRFTADAGHELRTPLTSVQATLSALSRHPDIPVAQRTELVLDALSEHRRLVDLLDGLQAMARGDASPGEIGDVELVEVVAASLDQASSRHPDVTWASSLPEGAVWLQGWEPGLRLLIDNLLENAARHGRKDGHVSVTVRPAGAASGAMLCVEDDGPGVAADQRARIFEPFVRVEGTQAPGSGLGLALVNQQVRAHAATIAVGRSPLGGARFEVCFGGGEDPAARTGHLAS